MRKRSAFTLVELLVVMAIILMLMGLLLGAVWSAAETAREANTRSSVRKLASEIAQRMESYETRRMPGPTLTSLGANPSAAQVQQMKVDSLAAKRQLERAEMPDQWSDVQSAPAWAQTATVRAYQRHMAAASGGTPTDNYQGAECLYMIVKKGRIGDMTGVILNDANMTVGDIDGDGCPEFLDGWGHPISWIRRPYGFVSKLQDPPGQRNIRDQHDILDVWMVDMSAEGYGTRPLVYSAGPDSQYGVNQYGASPLAKGTLVGDGSHLDNVHSHNVWSTDLRDLE